jgi:uncharacterized membrane protein
MSYTWAAIASVVVTTVLGDVLVSRAMRQTGDVGALYRAYGTLGTIKRVLGSPTLWVGVAAMAGSFFALLWALSWADLSLVAPASAALTFIGNALMAQIVLHENVNLRRWAAALLVAAGVFFLAV